MVQVIYESLKDQNALLRYSYSHRNVITAHALTIDFCKLEPLSAYLSRPIVTSFCTQTKYPLKPCTGMHVASLCCSMLLVCCSKQLICGTLLCRFKNFVLVLISSYCMSLSQFGQSLSLFDTDLMSLCCILHVSIFKGMLSVWIYPDRVSSLPGVFGLLSVSYGAGCIKDG